MDTVDLLTKFADPEVMKTLTVMERLTAGLITTVLGMGVTFASLIVLQFIIGLMAKLGIENKTAVKSDAPAQIQPEPVSAPRNNDEELVAAITVALALQLKTSVSSIVIRNIERVEEPVSAWQKAGIAELMNNSL